MIPPLHWESDVILRIPRESGDDPFDAPSLPLARMYSPRERG